MNTLEGIIEDVRKGELVSNKVIKRVSELIGQEEWNDLYDEENDVITTTGELLITLKATNELEEENYKLKKCLRDIVYMAESGLHMKNELAFARCIVEAKELCKE